METTPPLLLIVDDSRTSRTLIKGFVAQLRPDWRIVEADSGAAALAQIEAGRPDFITLDVNMPGMSGLEAAGRIRLRHPEIRVTLCTANIQDSVREAAARAGVGFIAKPITPKAVEQAVRFFEDGAFPGAQQQ